MDTRDQGLGDSVVFDKGEIFAGLVRTTVWTAQMTVSRGKAVLAGPLGLRYEIPFSRIRKARQAEGKFWKWSWKMKNTVAFDHESPDLPLPLCFRARKTGVEEMLSKLRIYGCPTA
jgi:hypothetical protein